MTGRGDRLRPVGHDGQAAPAPPADPDPAASLGGGPSGVPSLRELQGRIAEMEDDGRPRDAPGYPVLAPLQPLLPDGMLPRGAVTATADMGLRLALAAAPSEAGAWTGVVGMPDVGLLAAAGYGVDTDRLLLVDDPGQQWAEVVAALAPGVEVLLVAPPSPPTPEQVRRLGAILRRHGTAVIAPAWPGARVHLQITARSWTGLGPGHGQLIRRRIAVEATGRGGARRRAELWLPAASGGVENIAVDEHLASRPRHASG